VSVGIGGLAALAVLAGLGGETGAQDVRVDGPDLADMQCVMVAMESMGADEAENLATVSSITYYMGKLAGRGNVARWDRVLVAYRASLSDAARAKMVEDHGVRCTVEALVSSAGFAQLTIADATATLAKSED
jgi:hypothetical protein